MPGASLEDLLAICCDLDDVCKAFAPVYTRRLRHGGQRQRTRQTTLALSAILTLLVSFPWSHSRTLTHDSTADVMAHLHPSFPQLVGSQRFVERLPRALVPLCGSLATRQGRCTGIACMDSTPLAVGDHHRMATHSVFEGMATPGKTSMGWFYGFTWPVIVKDEGAWLALRVTPGHGDDRQPVQTRTAGLGGPLFGDRGSISQALHDILRSQGLELLTKIRTNRQHRVMRLWDTLLLRKRALIETVHDQLKHISHIAHTRHRSVTGFRVHGVAGLIA